MYYVYILKSLNKSSKVHVGFTPDIKNRLITHNEGKSVYTAKYKPWILLSYTTFQEKDKALKFEQYLKSGSGKAFIKKHYL